MADLRFLIAKQFPANPLKIKDLILNFEYGLLIENKS